MTQPTNAPVSVAVLGATGLVGQRILRRLSGHPWFRVVQVAASERSAGRRLGEILPPDVAEALDGSVTGLELESVGYMEPRATVALSALPSGTARDVEPRLAQSGVRVVSNASAFRADPAVPLVIPEVNPDHLALLETGQGGILTNPNCAVIPLVLALAPLHRAFGIREVVATTFQAVSGAGTSGPTVLELADNVLPAIGGGEEEKVEQEPRKLLGTVEPEGGATSGASGSPRVVRPAGFRVSATTTRVPVLHGHLVDVSVAFHTEPTPAQVQEVWTDFNAEVARGVGRELPSLPGAPLHLALGDPLRPQPRLDRDRGGGMAVTVGRLRRCPVHHVRFMTMAHNLERGAAGAAVANAELALLRGWIPGAATS